jgi:hypothetical protein
MDKRVTIIVQGGVVQEVYNPSNLLVEIIDFDNPSREIYGQNSGGVCPQETIDEIDHAIQKHEQEVDE